MSRKTNSASRNLTLALVLVVGSGGFLGLSLTVWNVSLVGSILIVVAFVEAMVILAGFFVFQRRHTSSVESKT